MRIKKFLALLIVLALTASLIPTAFAATEEAVNYNYVFKTAAHNLGSSTLLERRLTSGLHTIDNMAETSESSPWGFVNAYGCNTPVSYDARVLWEIKDAEGTGVAFAPGVSDEDVAGIRSAIVFEISASEGTYDASLSVSAGNSPATEVEVYLVPKGDYNIPSDYTVDATTNLGTFKESFYKNYIETLSANYRIGKVDLYNKSGDVYIGRTTLDQTSYYLVLVPCGVNENATPNGSWIMNLTNFKLDSVGEAAVANVELFENLSLVYKFKNPGATVTAGVNDGVFAAENIQVRFYGNTTDNAVLVTFGDVQVKESGTYNISFKTDIDAAENSAAPAIYVIEDSDTYTENTAASALLAKKSPVGYFDFSTLKAADGYMMVTQDGTKDTASSSEYLDSTKKYFIVMYMDAKSFNLNDVAYNANKGINQNLGKEGYSPAETGGIFKGDSRLGASYYQVIRFSGIKLTQIVESSAKETERQEAYSADRELYNELTSVKAENNKVNTFEYASTSTVSVVAQDIATGESVATDIVNENVDVNTEYTPSAPAVGDDYEFMYWAIGLGVNRKIVSFDKDKYSFTVAPGRNMVYAVYRKTNNTAKYAFFFDGSRTVLGRKEISNGEITLPELPGAMPGFGDSIGWKYTGEDDEAALPKDTVVENLTDDTFFVADYNNKQTVTITIDGTDFDFDYGTEVNLGDYAWVRENKSGENVFNYWKKGNEIISFKPDYTFKAYEDCTLTSTYAKYEPLNKTVRRILMSADSTTGITFAEFIGLGDAIEKGILFGTAETTTYADASAKAVMQTDGNVFSVVNETEKIAIGYAILSDGSIVYSDR